VWAARVFAELEFLAATGFPGFWGDDGISGRGPQAVKTLTLGFQTFSESVFGMEVCWGLGIGYPVMHSTRRKRKGSGQASGPSPTAGGRGNEENASRDVCRPQWRDLGHGSGRPLPSPRGPEPWRSRNCPLPVEIV
jgi:hypothetical protein